MSVFLDLSEYDFVCSQLQSSNSVVKELDAIFENSYDGFYIADNKGRVTRVNSAWEKICGFPRAEILGKTAHELVDSKWYDKSAAVAALESTLPALREVLPAHWYGLAAVLIALARVVQQTPRQDQQN